MSQVWSWVLITGSCASLWLAGSGRRVGWVLGAGVEVMWLTYGVATRQWGFAAGAVAYGAVSVRNAWRHHLVGDRETR